MSWSEGVLEKTKVDTVCIDWGSGVRWSPESLYQRDGCGRSPFSNFSSLPDEVR